MPGMVIRRLGPLVVAIVIAGCGSSSGTPGVPGVPRQSGAPLPTIGPLRTLGAFPTMGGGGSGGGGAPIPLPTLGLATPPIVIGGPVNGARQPIRYRPQVINDPASGNLPAITFLLPDGWQGQGGVQWIPEWERVAYLATTIVDPSSGLTIEWLPIQDFIWFDAPAGLSAPIGGNYQGKQYVPPISDPTQFVAQFWTPNVLSHLQGATLVGGTQVPAVAAEFLRGFGGPGQSYAYRLRYAFQQNGQPWEEDVFFALLYAPGQTITSWYVNFAYAVRAPKGVIDANDGVISTVVASRNTTAVWEANYRLVQRLFTQGIQQQMADTQAFGQLLAQHRAESQQLQAEVTAERQASQDRIADLRGQSLAGVDTYVSPIDGTYIQLPQRWAEYWVNPQGEYLTSDTPGLDPNQADNRGWQRLTIRR